MRDVVVLAVITAFFALCVAYVWWCDRIIGPDPDVLDDHTVDEASPWLACPVLTLVFANARDTFGLTSVLLLYLILCMVVALVGGVLPASAAEIGATLLANWYFTPPFYEFTIHAGENLLALVVFVVAAGMVAVLVDRVSRSRRQRPGPGRKPRRSPRWRSRSPGRARCRRCSARSGSRSASVRRRCCTASRAGGPWCRSRASIRRSSPTKPTLSAISAAT